MSQIALAVLALAAAALCIGVAGLLRRVTDVKLTLGGYNGERRQFIIDIGLMLPQPVLDEIPDPASDALIVVGASTCEVCHQLFAELDVVPGQVLAGVANDREDELDRLVVAGGAGRLSPAATEVLVREFDLSQVPVAIAERDGYVIGAAYGEEIGSGEKLGAFWAGFAAGRLEVAA